MEGAATRPSARGFRLSPDELRWRCDPDDLPFATTDDVEPIEGVVGQDGAVEALRHGLEIRAPGQNVFVRGLSGTGRLTLVRELVAKARLSCPAGPDLAFVHDPRQPLRPRLVELPRGRGHELREAIDELLRHVRDELAPSLQAVLRAPEAKLDLEAAREMRALVQPFRKELAAQGLRVVQLRIGATLRPAIVPAADVAGTGASPFEEPEDGDDGSDTDRRSPTARQQQRLAELEGALLERQRRLHGDRTRLRRESARRLLEAASAGVRRADPSPAVGEILDQLIDDVVTKRLDALDEPESFLDLHRVNVVQQLEPCDACTDVTPDCDGCTSCPVVIENAPTLERLVGTWEPPASVTVPPPLHLGLRPGSLLRANGGYLVLDADEILAEPEAWRALVRTLRTGLLDVVPTELSAWLRPGLVRPDPVPVRLKVVLIGDHEAHEALLGDEQFAELFKVLADFDSTTERDEAGLAAYAGVIARMARDEGLPPLDRGAVAALAERGARLAGRPHALTLRFGLLADVAREAAFLARRAGQAAVTAERVQEAAARRRARSDLPARQFQRLLEDGVLALRLEGVAVGQANGLTVVQAGGRTHGFPQRITATVGPGTGGVLDIEREAHLSGSIHTKGFCILRGLLRRLLHCEHPLVLEGAVAFEQSYGGIDGDSASALEACCLLSALTGVPLRQDLAMSGAVDQAGNVLAVGAINEKVEGFHDTCRALGLTGEHGVVIPGSNVGELALRDDVVDACRAGAFHVHAVTRIEEALELLTGLPAGERGPDGGYADGTLLERARARAREAWEAVRTSRSTA